MNTDIVKLKPCPFCGGFSTVKTVKQVDKYLFYATCNYCDSCSGLKDREDQAIAAWNRRVVEGGMSK